MVSLFLRTFCYHFLHSENLSVVYFVGKLVKKSIDYSVLVIQRHYKDLTMYMCMYIYVCMYMFVRVCNLCVSFCAYVCEGIYMHMHTRCLKA